MTDPAENPELVNRRLVQRLGWASLALGLPQVWRPDTVARLAGVDDDPAAAAVVRAVGVRELGHAALLLLGPHRSVWTRVAGDAVDLGLLGRAARDREGERRLRVFAATAVVLGISALDVRAALRTRHEQHGAGRPGPLVLRASTTVNRSAQEVYAFWRDLENLPTFMQHLTSVSVDDSGRSRWVAKAPLRRKVRWQAELTGDEPGRRISWLSLPGGDVDNAGTVHFAPAPGDRGTEVRVVLHYDVPGGRAGRALARLLGEEPEQQVRDDLRRFKQVLETGEVVRTDALPHGTDARHQMVQGAARPRRRETVRTDR